jgi:hypothetical protein
MSENEPTRAAIGALPPNPPSATVQDAAGGEPEVHVDFSQAKPETASAPEQFGAAELATLDPVAVVSSVKSLVALGTKVLGLLAKVPGPQQASAQEALKLLDMLNTILSKF